MDHGRLRLGLPCALGLLVAGCHARVPAAPIGPHGAEEPVVVTYPPPTVRAVIVPPAPREMRDPRWIDGEWTWQASRWVWRDGRWKDWAGSKNWFAPAAVVVLGDGTLWWREGSIHGPDDLPGKPAPSAAPPPAPRAP